MDASHGSFESERSAASAIESGSIGLPCRRISSKSRARSWTCMPAMAATNGYLT